jgi:hypothetical protein
VAERIEKPTRKRSSAEDAALELEIIAPERQAKIAGREITMGEPTWLEAIELDPSLQPVIAELEGTIGEGAPDFGELQRILYRHRDPIVTMIGICAGVEPEWIVSLSDTEGQKLSALFWAVNGPFFGRRIRTHRVLRAVAAAPAGRTSSTH